MNFECPHCQKSIIENNVKEDGAQKGDIVIKSKLVFLNDDGNILGKCSNCKKIIALPLAFVKSSNEIKG